MPTVRVNALLYKTHGGGVEKAILGAVQGLLHVARESSLGFRVFASADLFHALGNMTADGNVAMVTRPHATRLGRIAREQSLVLTEGRCRLWHHLGYVMPFFPSSAKIVVSVYDIIALTHPHLCTRANRLFYGIMLPRTLRRADLVIVPSFYVKDRIASRFPGIEPRIQVLPLPLSDGVLDAAAALRENGSPTTGSRPGKAGLLYVGNTGPKKNFGFLLECYASLPAAARKAHPLIVCGNRPGQDNRHASLVQSLGAERSIRFLGYLSEQDLVEQYRRARVLAYPSLVEGFGFPPLEAMALGTPAIVSDQGSLPEIAGSHGATVSPLDKEAFSASLLRLLTDDDWHSALAERGRAATPQTRWEDYAQELLNLYESLL